MRIEIFIDDESVPRQTLEPPATLELDTEGLADGPHRLRVHAIEDSGTVGVEEIPFTVRNGPGIAVVGLSDGDTVRGRLPLLINAFASRPGDAFEPARAETPAPIPTWAWVLFPAVLGHSWRAGVWEQVCGVPSAHRAGATGCIPAAQRQRGRDRTRSDRAHPHGAARTVGQDHRRRGLCSRHARVRRPAHRRRGG